MIVLVRVDNRLIHGQVLEAWLPRLRVRRIVVADDDAASSPLAKAAMTLCLPRSVIAEVIPVDRIDWAELGSSPDRVLVLFREIAALDRAVARGLTPALAPCVNLGNVHFATGRLPVTPSVFLSPDEGHALERLGEAGFTISVQATPTDAPCSLDETLRRSHALA